MPQNIIIRTPDELPEPKRFDAEKAAEEYNRKRAIEGEPLGVLFGDFTILKYLDIKEKRASSLRRMYNTIWAVCNDGKEVYMDRGNNYIIQLFTEGGTASRGHPVHSVCFHNGKLLDSGKYGLYSTLEDKVLISEEELRSKGIGGIKSLSSYAGSLFGLVDHQDNNHSFRQLSKNKEDYTIGEEIISYEHCHGHICQAVLLPFPSEINGKKCPFSVLSCANLNYLDINGKKISGIDALYNQQEIRRIALFSSSENMVEIIYSGWSLYNISKARIDMNNRTLITNEILGDGLSDWVLALDIVRSPELHRKLLEVGK